MQVTSVSSDVKRTAACLILHLSPLNPVAYGFYTPLLTLVIRVPPTHPTGLVGGTLISYLNVTVTVLADL